MLLGVLENYKNQGLIKGQQHPSLPLTIWNYTPETQYSGNWDDITRMCRGLVTHTLTGKVVARPMVKFFNLEEGKHTPTNQFEVFEKLDGSLIIMFWYKDQWVVASRGSFISDQANGARRILETTYQDGLPKNYTYIFEYISPDNRIVVDYGGITKVVLLGAINTDSGVEVEYEVISQVGQRLKIEVVKRYDGIKDYKHLKDTIKDNQEGYVIRFSNGERIKIKGDEYVRLHKIMTEVSTKSVWEYLSGGLKLEEMIQNVPDEFFTKIKDYEKQLIEQYDYVNKTIKSIYRKIMIENPSSDREYAMLVQKHNKKYWSILFNMKSGADYSDKIWNIIKPEYKKL